MTSGDLKGVVSNELQSWNCKYKYANTYYIQYEMCHIPHMKDLLKESGHSDSKEINQQIIKKLHDSTWPFLAVNP